jgi:hypothetical protein
MGPLVGDGPFKNKNRAKKVREKNPDRDLRGLESHREFGQGMVGDLTIG